jgi:hypothetical protein
MQEARDEVYSHLIARRAVARAALHLGSDSMTSESLDSLAACLIAYLERVGKTLAISTEASGRSSAHCNVLDAVRAVELCTSAAVQRMHRDGSEDGPGVGQQLVSSSGSGAISSSSDPQEELSWKGLAAFCFGPQWHMPNGISGLSVSAEVASIQAGQSKLEPKDPMGQSEESEQPLVESTSAAGGKAGPSATSIATGGDPTVEVVSRSGGWSAPYPDEIPAFPVPSSSRIANPHPLHAPYLHGRPDTSVDAAESEKDQEKMGEELEKIPDAFFGWGDLEAKKKPPRNEQETPVAAGFKRKGVTPDKDDEPPRKKSKRSGDDGGEVPAVAESNDTALNVPSFYPSFPRPSDSLARTILDAEGPSFVSAPQHPAASAPKAKAAPSSQGGTKVDPTLKVRSALVQLGQHAGSTYWGSGWDVPASEKRQASELAVPVGRSAEAGGPAPQQIVPLGRASGHPVSRILEGSMDAATMQ